jgi:hypothetical protein
MFARQWFAAWLSAMAGELIPVNDLDPAPDVSRLRRT